MLAENALGIMNERKLLVFVFIKVQTKKDYWYSSYTSFN